MADICFRETIANNINETLFWTVVNLHDEACLPLCTRFENKEGVEDVLLHVKPHMLTRNDKLRIGLSTGIQSTAAMEATMDPAQAPAAATAAKTKPAAKPAPATKPAPTAKTKPVPKPLTCPSVLKKSSPLIGRLFSGSTIMIRRVTKYLLRPNHGHANATVVSKEDEMPSKKKMRFHDMEMYPAFLRDLIMRSLM
jgi:pyruvate/2-oxoglutarate dehydrogenase complex dihydrolipoamide acyltransferase (E2) component